MRWLLILLGLSALLAIGGIVIGPPPQQPPIDKIKVVVPCPRPYGGGGQQIGKNPPQMAVEPRCDTFRDPKCGSRNPVQP